MRSSRAFVKSYQYVMEVILLYIVLVLFYIHTELLPPILPFVFITAVGALLITFILSLMKSNTPYFFVILVIPLLALISSEIGLGLSSSLIIAAFVCYRVVIHTLKTPKFSESMIINASILISGLVFFAANVQGYIYQDIVLYLLVTQLLIFMMGKMLSGLLSSSLMSKENEVKRQSGSLLGIFGGLFAGAIVLAFIFPFIFAKGLAFITSIVGKGLYVAAKPLFNAVEVFDEFKPRSGGESVGSLNWPEAVKTRVTLLDRLAGFDIWMLLSVVGILLLALLTFLIARKRLAKEHAIAADPYRYSTSTATIDKQTRNWKREKKQTPQAKVRRLVFELELLSASKGLGRYQHENVKEWLSRNNFSHHRLVDLYERVRYGNEVLTDEENKACEEIVKEVKSKIRSLKKDKNK
ncbi:hypothetical protein ACLM5H_15315 [Fredinandcohnia humi]